MRAAAALIAIALVLSACGGNGYDAPVARSPVTGVTPTDANAPAPAGDAGVTVENVVQACREKDGDRVRSFVVAAVAESEIEALFSRGRDVQLVSRTPAELNGGRASVAVRLRVLRDGESELVERNWELERGNDGVWRFLDLPDCF